MRRYNRAASVAPDRALAELHARASLAEEQRDKARDALVKARDKASEKCRETSELLIRARNVARDGGVPVDEAEANVAYWQHAYDTAVAVWVALDRLAKR